MGVTDDTTRGDATATADPAELEQRLAQAEERLAFYTSFDKLIQDNIARSSELMRDALALREQAIADMKRAQAELEHVQAEAAQAVAAANAQAVDERRRFGETLLALHGELGALQDAAAAIGRQVGSVLGELGAAEFVPVSWAAAEPAMEAVVADAAIEEVDGEPAAEMGEGAATADGVDAEVWNPLAQPDDAAMATGELIAYRGTGTGELSLEGAGDDVQVAERFPQEWESEIPAYAAVEAELADESEAPADEAEAESGEPPIEAETELAELVAAEAEEAEPEAVAADEAAVDDFASLEDFEAAVAALEMAGAEAEIDEEEGEEALAELAQVAEAVGGEDDGEAGAAPLDGDTGEETFAAAAGEVDEAVEEPAMVADVLIAEAEPELPVAGSDDGEAPALDAYDTPPTYREEGFLSGYAAELDQEEAPAAEAAYESAVAVETAEEPRSVMVLVHGVPRAAAALSLQRHLAGLGHVDSVEAREYAEGILRLQVTAHSPLALDDLRAWDGGTDLEPVHVQDDVIEVRLPGALGF
jgi:hypothetical protein